MQQRHLGPNEFSGYGNRDRMVSNENGTPTHLNNLNLSEPNSKLREYSLFSSGERPPNVTDFKHNSSAEQEVPFSELSPMMSGNKTLNDMNHPYNAKQSLSFNSKGIHPYFTTLMIKNIPNRLTQNILLNQIDEGFLGCYDFF